MSRYSRNEILEKIELATDDMNTLYKEPCVNYRGKTSDTNELYTEVIAEFLLEHWGLFNQIKMITRTSSYHTESHDGTTKRPRSNRTEERIALSMYGKSYDYIGKILDYQVPLKNVRGDKAGKVDLLSYNQNILRLLELKKPDSRETLLRCVLEGETYLRIIDKEKLLEDFKLDNNQDVEIVAASFIFDGSLQHEKYKQISPKLMSLIEKFNSEIFLIKEVKSGYQVDKI